MTIVRRIRGVIGCALLGAILWSLVAFAAMLAYRLGIIPGVQAYFGTSMSRDLFVATVYGAIIRAMTGALFGVLVLASEQNRSLEHVRAKRTVAIGAEASASIMAVIWGNALVALGAGALGAASSADFLRIARRATRPQLPGGVDEPQLSRGAT